MRQMNKFKKSYGDRPRSGGRFNDRGDRSPSRFGGRSERPMQKFDAVCSKCGKACQVPFRPNGTRPVYCTDCFGGPQQASRNKGSFPMRDGSPWPTAPAPRTGGKTIADLERQIGAMNTKIDTMLRILEAVSAEAENDSEDEDAEELPEVTAPRKRAPRPRV
jgi:CxxC-x17-CxxC domain-containing protein